MNKPQWYRDMEIAIADLFNEYQWQAKVEAQAQTGLLENDDRESDADINEYSLFEKRSISSLNAQWKKAKKFNEFNSF